MFVSAKPSTRMLPISKQNVLFQLLTMGMSFAILSLGMPTKMDHSILASFSSFPTRRKKIESRICSWVCRWSKKQDSISWTGNTYYFQFSQAIRTSPILSSIWHLPHSQVKGFYFLLPGAEKSSWKYAISYEPDTIYQSVISYRPVEQTKFEGKKQDIRKIC